MFRFVVFPVSSFSNNCVFQSADNRIKLFLVLKPRLLAGILKHRIWILGGPCGGPSFVPTHFTNLCARMEQSNIVLFPWRTAPLVYNVYMQATWLSSSWTHCSLYTDQRLVAPQPHIPRSKLDVSVIKIEPEQMSLIMLASHLQSVQSIIAPEVINQNLSCSPNRNITSHSMKNSWLFWMKDER